MAANLISITPTNFDGQSMTTALVVNKGKIMDVISTDSGNSCVIPYRRQLNNLSPSRIEASDNYSTVRTAIEAPNGYTSNVKFQVAVLSRGSDVFASPINQVLSVDSIIWASADPTDANKTNILYQDELLGETIIKVNISTAALITATTS